MDLALQANSRSVVRDTASISGLSRSGGLYASKCFKARNRWRFFRSDGARDIFGCWPTHMKLVEFLQGKWLGHPLHAALVHVPVGAWFVACALDVGMRLGLGDVIAGRVALWCVGIGLAGAVLAVPPGVADWSAVKKEKPAWKLGLYHLLLNVGATLLWAVNFG